VGGVRRRQAALHPVVEAAVDHHFADPALLDDVLAHADRLTGRRKGRPALGHERLEFLGDRVLGLIVAHALIERYRDEPEGALNLRLVELVRAETLAGIAAELGVEGWLRQVAGAAEATATTTLLADTLEALIGALYLDGGLAAAEAFVRRHWAERLQRAAPRRDAKTALQEWAQARGLALPTYRVTEAAGPDHELVFAVEVALDDLAPAGGQGRSKRAAEQAAAARLLERLQGGGDG
jgi:ribonuclease-3